MSRRNTKKEQELIREEREADVRNEGALRKELARRHALHTKNRAKEAEEIHKLETRRQGSKYLQKRGKHFRQTKAA